jgi:hypothetical protein
VGFGLSFDIIPSGEAEIGLVLDDFYLRELFLISATGVVYERCLPGLLIVWVINLHDRFQACDDILSPL